MQMVSRRNFFKKLALLGLVTFSTTTMYAKGAKDKFNYQDIPKDDKKCIDCMHFISETNECRIIEGTINPNGWCTLYFKKPN
jgi:hypothetical protein